MEEFLSETRDRFRRIAAETCVPLATVIEDIFPDDFPACGCGPRGDAESTSCTLVAGNGKDYILALERPGEEFAGLAVSAARAPVSVAVALASEAAPDERVGSVRAALDREFAAIYAAVFRRIAARGSGAFSNKVRADAAARDCAHAESKARQHEKRAADARASAEDVRAEAEALSEKEAGLEARLAELGAAGLSDSRRDEEHDRLEYRIDIARERIASLEEEAEEMETSAAADAKSALEAHAKANAEGRRAEAFGRLAAEAEGRLPLEKTAVFRAEFAARCLSVVEGAKMLGELIADADTLRADIEEGPYTRDPESATPVEMLAVFLDQYDTVCGNARVPVNPSWYSAMRAVSWNEWAPFFFEAPVPEFPANFPAIGDAIAAIEADLAPAAAPDAESAAPSEAELRRRVAELEAQLASLRGGSVGAGAGTGFGTGFGTVIT